MPYVTHVVSVTPHVEICCAVTVTMKSVMQEQCLSSYGLFHLGYMATVYW